MHFWYFWIKQEELFTSNKPKSSLCASKRTIQWKMSHYSATAVGKDSVKDSVKDILPLCPFLPCPHFTSAGELGNPRQNQHCWRSQAGSEQQNLNKTLRAWMNLNKILRAWINLNKILSMKTESYKLRSSHCTRAHSRWGLMEIKMTEMGISWPTGIPCASLRLQDSPNFILTSAFGKAEVKATLWRLYRYQYPI